MFIHNRSDELHNLNVYEVKHAQYDATIVFYIIGIYNIGSAKVGSSVCGGVQCMIILNYLMRIFYYNKFTKIIYHN